MIEQAYRVVADEAQLKIGPGDCRSWTEKSEFGRSMRVLRAAALDSTARPSALERCGYVLPLRPAVRVGVSGGLDASCLLPAELDHLVDP
jgi:hypothetical protein